MIKTRETAFSAVCLSFSVLMLVLCMLLSAQSAAVNDEIARITDQTKALERENRLIYVRLENELSLRELESYALEELGMQRCSPAQIIYIEYTDK